MEIIKGAGSVHRPTSVYGSDMKYPVTGETTRFLVLKYNTTEKQLVCDQRPGSNPLKVKALDNYYPRLYLKENSDSKFSIYSWLIINVWLDLLLDCINKNILSSLKSTWIYYFIYFDAVKTISSNLFYTFWKWKVLQSFFFCENE